MNVCVKSMTVSVYVCEEQDCEYVCVKSRTVRERESVCVCVCMCVRSRTVTVNVTLIVPKAEI